VKFATREEYEQKIAELLEDMADSDGNDSVVIYIAEEKVMKKLPPNKNVHADEALEAYLGEKYGKDNIKIVWDVKKQ
jgi:DNA polymerase-3 subunit alpha